jgi:hypothetical protein
LKTPSPTVSDWLDLEEHGYSLVRRELAVFKPEV